MTEERGIEPTNGSRRLLLAASVLALGAVVVVGLYLRSEMPELVREAIERRGSKVTGTDVRVDSVSLSLHSGEGSLKGLSIANPEGFSDRDAFQLEEVLIDLDVASLVAGPIVLKRVRVVSPRVLFEFNRKLKSNIDGIRKSARSHGKKGKGKAGSGEANRPRKGRRLIIRDFVFEGGRLSFEGAEVGIRPFETDLAAIHLTDLGGPAGEAPERVAAEILVAVGGDVLQVAAQKGIEHEVDRILGGKPGHVTKDFLRSLFR